MRYAIVAATVMVALFCRAFLVSVYKVPTQKMAPTILAGDYVLASKSSYGLKFPWSESVYFLAKPERGDLIVFHKNSQIFIKRVIGVPRDEVESINGEYQINSIKCVYKMLEKNEDPNYRIYEEKCGESQRNIIRPIAENKLVQMSKTKLGDLQFLVANDNRNLESDPNLAELISNDQIIGKPLLVWMSYSSTQDFISNTLGIRWNRILTKLK